MLRWTTGRERERAGGITSRYELYRTSTFVEERGREMREMREMREREMRE